MIKQKNKPHPIWKRTKNISTIIIIISALSACNTINNSNDPSLYPTFIGKNKIRGSKNFKYSKIDVNTKIIDNQKYLQNKKDAYKINEKSKNNKIKYLIPCRMENNIFMKMPEECQKLLGIAMN